MRSVLWTRRRVVLERMVKALLALPLLMCVSFLGAAAAPANQAVVSPAANVAAKLGTPDNPIVSVNDYTQLSDPEQLLGLPGQYGSKAYFRDSSSLEGFVEVFPTASDARFRKTTLEGAQFQSNNGAFDYITVRGPVLVHLLGPTAAQQLAYEQRLTGLFPRL